MKPTQQQIESAAAAIANARGGRRGLPPVTNILEMLPENLREEVTEDAEAALEAAGAGELLAACRLSLQVCRFDAGEGRKSYDLAFVRERLETAISNAERGAGR